MKRLQAHLNEIRKIELEEAIVSWKELTIELIETLAASHGANVEPLSFTKLLESRLRFEVNGKPYVIHLESGDLK